MQSRSYFRPALVTALLLGSSVLLISCGGPATVQGPGPRKGLTKVTGTLTVDGQPAARVLVNAMPIEGDPDNPHVGQAVSDENGSFTFTTYTPNDGLPAGEHVLRFTLPRLGGGRMGDGRSRGDDPPDDLGGQYSDLAKNKNNDKMKFMVTAGQELVIGPFNLKKPEGEK